MRAPLPPNYLAKKGERWRSIRLTDVLVLLRNVIEGSNDPNVGFEDALQTLDQLVQKLNKHKVMIQPSDIESALWSCNLRDELGKFEGIKGETFEQFAKRLVGPDSFSRDYNFIVKKDGTDDVG